MRTSFYCFQKPLNSKKTGGNFENNSNLRNGQQSKYLNIKDVNHTYFTKSNFGSLFSLDESLRSGPVGLDRLTSKFFPADVGLDRLASEFFAPSWGSPRSGSCPPPPTCDLQWVYIGLRWPFGGLGCVGCLLGILYFHGFVVAVEVCGCEFWWVFYFWCCGGWKLMGFG